MKSLVKIFKANDSKISIIDRIDGEFEVKRVFIIHMNKNSIRGGHGHYIQTQRMYCLSGKINIILNTEDSEESLLLNETESVLIKCNTWVEFQAIENSELLVCSSHYYDESDYFYEKY